MGVSLGAAAFLSDLKGLGRHFVDVLGAHALQVGPDLVRVRLTYVRTPSAVVMAWKDISVGKAGSIPTLWVTRSLASPAMI
jgi:hypothetical protein